MVADRGPMRFTAYPSDTDALAAVSGMPAVERLTWFNHGFMRAEVRNGQLVLSDLRMGLEPDYSFNFVVAEQVEGQWQAIEPPVQLPWSIQIGQGLSRMTARIWGESVSLHDATP